MNREKLVLEDITNLDFTTVIWFAAPIMFALVLVEYLIGKKQNKKLYNGKDFLASLSIGIGNLILNGFMKLGMFAVFLGGQRM